MIGMLALLYLAWDWARQPSTWRWLADDAGAADAGPGEDVPAKADGAAPSSPEGKAPAVPPSPAPVPVATGPTDEDPDEQAGAEEEFQAISDRTLEIKPVEMVAYKRVLQWVVHQPASVMRKRARKDLTFHDFMTSPDKHRGALVELMLDARLIRSTEFRASDGTDLFEVWGFTADSGTWLYDTIVVGLPQGMPVGQRVNERVRFVGYFFKLQGYHEANAKPRSAPLAAPMLIGRLVWIQAPPAPTTKGDASWTAIAVVGFAVVVCLHFLWLFLRSRRRASSMRPIGRPKPGALSIEEWFEKAEEGTAPLGDAQTDPIDGTLQAAGPAPSAAPDSGNSDASGEPIARPLDGEVGGGG